MNCTTGFHQFLILLYKGALLRKRHYIVTFFELVIPVFIASILPMIMSEQRASYPRITEMEKEYRKNQNFWKEAETYEPFSPYGSTYNNYYIVYTPPNPMTANFIENVITRFKSDPTGRYNYYGDTQTVAANTEDELEKYCLNAMTGSRSVNVIGTIFRNFDRNTGELPESLDYTIRFGDQSYATSRKYRVNGPNYDTSYKDSNFLTWQASVEETFIETKMNQSGKQLDYKVSMQKFPYPEHKNSRNVMGEVSIVPMLFLYGYLIFTLNLLRRVIEEKNNGSKELMKMMGMTDTVYWISTFANYIIVALFTIICITIIYKIPLKTGYIFLENTNIFLLFLTLLLYMSSVILFCLAFSIFFTRGKQIYSMPITFSYINSITHNKEYSSLVIICQMS